MRVWMGRIILIAAAAILLALAGSGISYLRSARFQEKARATIIARIEQATGLRVQIERLTFDILRGTFHVKRLSLKSRKETGSRFEFSVDEVSGSFRLAALWRPKFELGELNLIRPRIVIREEPGGPPSKLEAVIRKSLDVAARKATIRDGWFELNERRVPLNMSAEAFDCSIQYQPSPHSYAVRVSYKNSPLQWAGRKFVYDLTASVNLLPTGLEIVSYDLREHRSRFQGGGRLNGWRSPTLEITTVGIFAGEDMPLITPDIKDARGNVSVIGDLRWDGRAFHMAGRFTAETLRYRQTAAHALRGLFEIKDNVLLLRGVNGRMGEGGFQVDGSIQLKDKGTPPHHIRISAKDIVLRDASGLLDLRTLALENKVDAEATLEWRRGQEDLDVEGVADLHGPAAPPGSGSRTALGGSTQFSFRDRSWYLKRVSLDSPDTHIRAVGTDPGRSRIQIQLATTRPAEIFSIVRGFSPALEQAIAAQPDLMGLAGRYALDGEIRLQLPAAMSYEGLAQVTQGRLGRYAIESLQATTFWDGSLLRMRSLRLRHGAQSIDGDFSLVVPQGDTAPDLTFAGTLHRISLGELRDFGIDLKAQVAGLLSGQGRMSYERGLLQGDGKFQIEKGSYNQEPFDILSATLQVQDRVLHIADGQLKRGSASVSVEGQVDLDSLQMDLSARLRELPLADIPEIRSSKISVDGRVSASGEIRGTPEQPEFKGNVDIASLSYAGWNLGTGKATLDFRDRTLTAKMDVKSELGGFQAEGRISTGPGYPGRATLEFNDWNVKKILASNAPSLFSDFSTALRGSLLMEGPFADVSRLKFSGDVDGARLKIHGYELRNDGKIRFTATSEKLIVEEARLVGEGSSLAIEKDGIIPFGDTPALNLHLTGRLNLGFLDRLDPKVGVSGSVMLNVRATGSRLAPEVIGNAVLADARIAHEDLPYPFSSLRGSIIFSRNLVRLESVTGTVALGTIRVTGSVEHQNAQLQGINLQASIRDARLRYPKDFLSTVDAELSLRGGADARVLSGDVNVLHAQYLRDFSVLEQIIGQSSGPSGGGPVANPLLAATRLNVAVHSRDGLYIDNELARIQGGMSLTLRGTLAYPSVTGRAEAIEGAIFFRGNRFDIVHASADFIDRNRIIPVLDVRAEADVRSFRLRLDLSGDLEHLRLNMSSDPPLSNVDIVSLLTTGKSDQIGVENPRHQAEMTGLSAASILSESLTGVIGKRVERIFGISSFRIDPFLAGTDNDPTARVTITERISKDVTVIYSRNLTTTEDQIIVIEYDVNKNLSIVATRNEDGKYGLDLRFRKRFR
jgi:hypothetical protein